MAKNNYKGDIVLDNMENIKKWLSEGKTMASIAKALKVSKGTLYKYLQGFEGGLDTLKKECRGVAVEALENTMFMSACGYERKVKKYAKVKRTEYVDGKKNLEYEEMVEYEETIYYPPDTTAGIFLLKNWSNYMNEPRTVDLRREELELRKKELEAKIW